MDEIALACAYVEIAFICITVFYYLASFVRNKKCKDISETNLPISERELEMQLLGALKHEVSTWRRIEAQIRASHRDSDT